MKKAIVILLALCLAVSLGGCGGASGRLIPRKLEGVSRIHMTHDSLDPERVSGALQRDGETEITDPKTIGAIIKELHAYRSDWPHRPMSGARRIEFSFYSADELLGQIWLDDEGTCVSTFSGQGNGVVHGGFDFARWEALFSGTT